MPETSHATMDFRIVEVDDLHDAGLEKQIDQLGRGLAVVLGIGPPYRKLDTLRKWIMPLWRFEIRSDSKVSK